MAIRVLAAVIEREGLYLICRRPAHKRHGGLWEFPGGKIEEGESDLEAMARELEEELDVRVTSIGEIRFVIQDGQSPFSIEFLPVEIEGEPRVIEHSEHAWVAPSSLGEYSLAPSDRAFAEREMVELTGANTGQSEPA